MAKDGRRHGQGRGRPERGAARSPIWSEGQPAARARMDPILRMETRASGRGASDPEMGKLKRASIFTVLVCYVLTFG